MSPCGHEKHGNGFVLVCQLLAGHAGPHGMLNAGVLYTRWEW